MAGQPGRRSVHEQAVARRLELLGAELAAVRGPTAVRPAGSVDAAGDHTHTRIRPGREPQPLSDVRVAAALQAPGRHAARGRLALGTAQLVVVALVVLAGLAIAAWWLLGGGTSEVAAPPPRPAADLVTIASTATATGAVDGQGTVTVDVAGKVRRPGIAVLDAGSRVIDALEAAGGARAGVDLTVLNLARVLVDGEQILVGVPLPTGVAATMSGGTSPVATLVNINTADQVGLESLPDVGPVTAQSILAWRSEHGAFTSVDQLLDVDGIGEATLAKLVPYVTL
jgi:competence protein ComEA